MKGLALFLVAGLLEDIVGYGIGRTPEGYIVIKWEKEAVR